MFGKVPDDHNLDYDYDFDSDYDYEENDIIDDALATNDDHYDNEADDDDNYEYDEPPTSVKSVHHSLISADGLVGVPHLGNGDHDDHDGEMNKDDDGEDNDEYI